MNYSINAPYECKTPIFLAKKSSAFSEINDWALRYRTSSANCQMYVPLLKNIFLVSEIGWHQPAAVQAGIVLKYVTYPQLHIWFLTFTNGYGKIN